MGYTHYWYRPVGQDIEPKTWERFCKGAKKILKAAARDEVELVYDYDETDKPPQVDGEAVRFNGADDEGHETFIITRECPPQPDWRKNDDRYFDFCKTAYKPYDGAVTSILVLARDILGFDISSDGDEEAFAEAPYRNVV